MEDHFNTNEEIPGNSFLGESAEIVSEDSTSPLLDEPEVYDIEGSSTAEQQPLSKHLCSLALTLFDRTQPLHGLNEASRDILEMAVQMQDLTITPSKKKKPYRAALELVQFRADQELPGETGSPEELETLAAVLVLHQGKLKRKEIARLNLSPIQQRQVLTLVALMRIATGLDHSGSRETVIQKVETARDGMWIVVDGPHAATDAAAAQLNARLWAKIGYPEVQVLESAEAAIQLQPFPEPQEQIGIQPGDSFSEAGRKVMRYHFAQMLRHEEGTRLGEDIEALHDMRVATRRLRAAFEVFGEAFEPGVLKSYLKGLRATGRALGSVRDLDVFMEKAQRYLETLPEGEQHNLDPLLTSWRDQRDKARIQMLAHIDSQEYATFKRKFNVFLNTPGAGTKLLSKDQPVPHLVSELAPLLIYTRLAVVRAFDPFLADAPIERLHALRIELKKLRYTVEYFREVLGNKAELAIDNLKRLQDHLGDLNDAQVATQILREFIDTWEPRQAELPISERQNLEGVVNYMAARHAERHRLMITFQKAWKDHINKPAFRRNLAQAVSIL